MKTCCSQLNPGRHSASSAKIGCQCNTFQNSQILVRLERFASLDSCCDDPGDCQDCLFTEISSLIAPHSTTRPILVQVVGFKLRKSLLS